MSTKPHGRTPPRLHYGQRTECGEFGYIAIAKRLHPVSALDSTVRYEGRYIEVTYGAHDRLFVVSTVYKRNEQNVVNSKTHCPDETLIEKRVIPPRLSEAEPNGPMQVILRVFERIDRKDGLPTFVDTPASFRQVGKPLHSTRATVRVQQKKTEMLCTLENMIPSETRPIERAIAKPAHVTIRRESCDDG